MQYDLIIDGQKVPTDNYFDVINPATEEVVAQCPSASEDHLNAAVAAARKAFPAWSALSDEERKEKLGALAGILAGNKEELAKLTTQEQGRPLEGLAFGALHEIGGAAHWTQVTAGLDMPVEIAEENDEHRVEVHRKPLGVVASITPWNFPVMIAIWHVMPALRAGNTVVIKPSSLTPLATLRFVELAQEVLPPGVLNIVTGEGGLGRLIAGHPDINKIVFTGSTPTGVNIMKNAADNLKRLTLELGGNDAAIILPDINPADIAKGVFVSAFINNGQTCGALKRLYVHEDIYDQMCEALTKVAGTIKVGNGMDPESHLGPVQNKEQLDFVRELVADAKANGGRVLVGGEDHDGPGYFYPITLIADIDNGTRLVDEEPFGPVLPIIKYTDIEEVLQRANDNPNGLGGSVWSKDIKKATELAMRLESGTAWINAHAKLSPNVPFGGVKQSGIGVEFGKYGLEEYTSIQSVFVPK